jgi:hypothetical protein
MAQGNRRREGEKAVKLKGDNKKEPETALFKSG